MSKLFVDGKEIQAALYNFYKARDHLIKTVNNISGLVIDNREIKYWDKGRKVVIPIGKTIFDKKNIDPCKKYTLVLVEQ